MIRYTVIGFVMLSLCVMGASQSFAQDDPDLIIYFQYEEIDNGVVRDQSGYGHDGTINGDVTLDAEGKRGKAAKFAGGG